MEPMPVVLDISSDEEPDLEEGSKMVDYDWIRELLGMSDKESDDSDEVVIVGEVKPERKSKSSRPTAEAMDDDCVVLDCDPENRVTSVNDSATGSDELLIVGEKGQIACRDYPHARHLCAKFPFSSTPHEKHCDQCHCFVCDLLAPCLKWGTGVSSTDHCHATDKVDMWNIQRKNFKLNKSAPSPASTNYSTSPSVGHPQQNQVCPLGIIQLSSNSISQNQASRPTAMRTSISLNSIPKNQASEPTIMRSCSTSLNSTLQNQVSRPNIIPVCSSTTNSTVTNGTNLVRCQESGSTLARNRNLPHLVSRQWLGVRNNPIRRDRGRGAISLGPPVLRSPLMSKEVCSVGGVMTVNHSAHDSSGYSNPVSSAQQYDRYHATTGLSNDRNPNGWNNVWHTTNLSSYPHPSSAQLSLDCSSENNVPSESQAYSQPLSQVNGSQNLLQSCIHGSDALSSYVACVNSNQQGNEHQLGSENKDASENFIQLQNPSQDACQQKPHEENQCEAARKADFTVFNSSWTENTGQSIEPLVDNSCIQSSGSINQPLIVKESDTQFAGSTEPLLADVENWLMDKEPVPVVADGALPAEFNIPSPDITPIDAGLLFLDFETSWNGLAHA